MFPLMRLLIGVVLVPASCLTIFAQALNLDGTIKMRAESGDSEAQFKLGLMYATGDGVLKDDTEAFKWQRKAADQGFAAAQASLGVMYMSGKGVPKDDVEAYAWFNIAAVSFVPAQKLRDRLELTPEEKARAQKRSTELYNEIEDRKKKAVK
jgi:TPR repeat protein